MKSKKDYTNLKYKQVDIFSLALRTTDFKDNA